MEIKQKKIKKILVANRGEIAVRIFRSCKELGIDTVAVHSTADEDSLHVKMADESVCIGAAQATASYLSIPSVLSAAEITGADAIHPGYGFMAENGEFANMCSKWGLTFIGPSSEIINKMGSKIESKKIAVEAGIPILEPILVDGDKKREDIEAEAEKVGYPLLIKASAGGGGRGMQKVENHSELNKYLKILSREAEMAFGDGTLFVEKFIEKPRHIEVQILADQYGETVHLGERDCTVQRRYQKLVEETPCLLLNDETRESICQDAVKLCKHVGYYSAGTVEFLYDMGSNQYYFMEMNTRIQVEHPVTEERCHFDIIAEQIRIAEGNKISVKQEEIVFLDHVIECRINAEDPKLGLPSPGQISHYHRPGGMGVRIDDYIYTGFKVPPFYDSMISKIIVRAKTREKCINRMLRALEETVIGGIKTNIELHKEILRNSDFQSNNYTTDFVKHHKLC
jgi:acetyl-CoA carboxylase biotin carboxylase subunit